MVVFTEKTIDQQKDDLLLLYTDGVTEAVNLQNQEFGRKGLEALIRQAQRMPAKEVINNKAESGNKK